MTDSNPTPSTDMSERLYKDPMERFVDSIDITSNGCWQWQKRLGVFGYGTFSIGETRYLAHRFSYQIYVGDIPEGLQIDHLCRNRGCVNPDHLEAVTIRENVLRGEGLSAKAFRSTSCPKGHPYNSRNNRGNRICLKCCRENDKKSKEKKKIATKLQELEGEK